MLKNEIEDAKICIFYTRKGYNGMQLLWQDSCGLGGFVLQDSTIIQHKNEKLKNVRPFWTEGYTCLSGSG